MKKYWIVWLLLGVLLLCASCGGNEEESSVVEESKQESSVAEESSKVKEESSEVEESSVAEESSVQEESSLAEESSQQEESSEIEKIEEFASFADVVAYLEAVHGEGHVDRGAYFGLCHVKLIDLDCDGVDELFCAYNADPGGNSYWNEIYQYQDGKVVKILDRMGLNRGTSISPSAEFYYMEDGVYIRYGSESRYQYYTLRDGEMVAVIEEVHAWLEGGEGYIFDGQEYTKEAYEGVLSERFSAVPMERYIYMAAELEGTLQPGVEDVSVSEMQTQAYASISEAYVSVIEALLQEYGYGEEIRLPDTTDALMGFSVVRLIDFDGDGQDELLCAYCDKEDRGVNFKQSIYRCENGQLIQLYSGDTSQGMGLKPGVRYETDGTQTFLIMTNGDAGKYQTLRDGEWVTDHSYDKGTTSFDGEVMSREEVEAKLKEYYGDTELVESILFYHNTDSRDVFNKTIAVIMDLYQTAGKEVPGEILEWEASCAYASYADVVAELEEKHGKTTTGTDGLCMVKLLDLNNDGIDELFCSWALSPGNTYQNSIYTWQKGKIVRIFEQRGLNGGNGVKPMINWYVGENATYIVYGSEQNYDYMTLVNGKMVTAASQNIVINAEMGNYWLEYALKGESCTENEFEAFLDSMELVGYWYGTEGVPEGWSSVSVEEVTSNSYNEVVSYLESVHGEAHEGKPGVEGGNFMYGLCFVKLIDLDYDGTEELFVSYPLNDGVPYYINEIYHYQNEKAVMIYQRTGMNLGTSVQPCVQLIYADEGVYVRYGSEWEYEYVLLKEGQMVTAVTENKMAGPDGNQVEFNGQMYSDYASYQKAYDEFFGDDEIVTYFYELDLEKLVSVDSKIE